MLVLNYDDIADGLLSFWEEFLIHMDSKNTQLMGPGHSGVEKKHSFVSYKDNCKQAFSLIEEYLTDDHSVSLEARRAIFFDILKNAELMGVFSSLDHDPLLFNHEQSESFQKYVQSKKLLKELADEIKKKTRRSGDLNMNVFFIQLDMQKLEKYISEYENGSKQYALLDPLKYLTTVITSVLEHSHKECLRCHRGEIPAPEIHELGNIVSVGTPECNTVSVQRIEQRRNLMDEIDREIKKQNQNYMNRIINIYGKKQ